MSATQILDYDSVSSVIQQQIITEIYNFLYNVDDFKGYCLGDFVRNFIVPNKNDSKEIIAPKEFSIYFRSEDAASKFISDNNDILDALPGKSFILKKLGVGIAKVTINVVNSNDFKFDIDHLAYNGSTFYYVDDNFYLNYASKEHTLREAIKQRKAKCLVIDYERIAVLLNEGFTVEVNGKSYSSKEDISLIKADVRKQEKEEMVAQIQGMIEKIRTWDD